MLIKLLIAMSVASGSYQIKNDSDFKTQPLTIEQSHLYEGCFQYMFEKINNFHRVSEDLVTTMRFLEKELYKQFKKDCKTVSKP